jgi:hypothetical protein
MDLLDRWRVSEAIEEGMRASHILEILRVWLTSRILEDFVARRIPPIPSGEGRGS